MFQESKTTTLEPHYLERQRETTVNRVDGLETRWKFNRTHYLC